MEKKEKEQQRALAKKVAILSDSDIAEVQTAVEKVISDRPLGDENTTAENDI